MNGDIHVMPVGDAKPHEETVACPCRPIRDRETPSVVIHNAWDRREIVEEIEANAKDRR